MAFVNTSRVYQDYDPPSDLVTEEGCDTILIYLPGYMKEQLRVQLTTSRILRISGERQIDGNKWMRFNKEFRVPSNCDVKEITAKYEGGILYLRQPKLTTTTAAAAAAPGAAEQPADRGKTSAARPPPQQQAPDLPQRQPQQQAPDLPPRHQPQQAPHIPPRQPPQVPDLPPRQPQQFPELSQPQAQQQAPILPRPQPQPPLKAPLPETQEGLEEKTGRKDSHKDAAREEKDDGGKDNFEVKSSPTRVGGRGGLYRELSKPDNCKRLVVSVLLVLGIGFYITYTFKTFLGVSGYDKEL